MASKSRRSPDAKSSRRKEGFEGSVEERLLPLFAILLGVTMGIGLAYMAKKYFLRDLSKTPSVTYVEERKPRMSLQDPNVRRSVTLTTTLDTSPVNTLTPSRPVVFTEESSRQEPETRTNRPPLSLFRTPARESSRTFASPLPVAPRSALAAKRPQAGAIEEPSIDSPGIRNQGQTSNAREAKVPSELRNVSLKSMSFNKSSFQRCQEECFLNFRNSRGEVVRTKLKKSVFAKLLQNHQGSVDIDGIETRTNGQRLVTVRSLKPLLSEEPSEEIAKTNRKVKSEKSIEANPEPEASEELAASSEPSPLRARLEAPPVKRKVEEAAGEETEEEDTSSAQSFQARLKRSVE